MENDEDVDIDYATETLHVVKTGMIYCTYCKKYLPFIYGLPVPDKCPNCNRKYETNKIGWIEKRLSDLKGEL